MSGRFNRARLMHIDMACVGRQYALPRLEGTRDRDEVRLGTSNHKVDVRVFSPACRADEWLGFDAVRVKAVTGRPDIIGTHERIQYPGVATRIVVIFKGCFFLFHRFIVLSGDSIFIRSLRAGDFSFAIKGPRVLKACFFHDTPALIIGRRATAKKFRDVCFFKQKIQHRLDGFDHDALSPIVAVQHVADLLGERRLFHFMDAEGADYFIGTF